MLWVSTACIDGELYHTVNSGLHCQFKYLCIKGATVSPIFCVDSRSRQRTLVQAPGPSQLSSKHFPSQRSNHLPSDRPLGPQIRSQVQSRVLGEAGRDGGRERGRTKGTLAKRKRSEIAREQGGGFEGGSQASWCIGKVGKRCCSKGGGGRGKLMRGGRKVEKMQCKRCQARSPNFLLYDATFGKSLYTHFVWWTETLCVTIQQNS